MWRFIGIPLFSVTCPSRSNRQPMSAASGSGVSAPSSDKTHQLFRKNVPSACPGTLRSLLGKALLPFVLTRVGEQSRPRSIPAGRFLRGDFQGSHEFLEVLPITNRIEVGVVHDVRQVVPACIASSFEQFDGSYCLFFQLSRFSVKWLRC